MPDDKPYYKPAGHPAVTPIMASLHNRPGWMLTPAPCPFAPLTDEQARQAVGTMMESLNALSHRGYHGR